MPEFAFVIPNGARLQEVAGLADTGKLKVIIEKEFPLSEAKAAQDFKLVEPEAKSFCGSLEVQ